MPSATSELQAIMQERFGTIDCWPPLKFLLDRGYTEEKGLIKPPYNHISVVEEWECIDFLFQEWDFAYEEN